MAAEKWPCFIHPEEEAQIAREEVAAAHHPSRWAEFGPKVVKMSLQDQIFLGIIRAIKQGATIEELVQSRDDFELYIHNNRKKVERAEKSIRQQLEAENRKLQGKFVIDFDAEEVSAFHEPPERYEEEEADDESPDDMMDVDDTENEDPQHLSQSSSGGSSTTPFHPYVTSRRHKDTGRISSCSSASESEPLVTRYFFLCFVISFFILFFDTTESDRRSRVVGTETKKKKKKTDSNTNRDTDRRPIRSQDTTILHLRGNERGQVPHRAERPGPRSADPRDDRSVSPSEILSHATERQHGGLPGPPVSHDLDGRVPDAGAGQPSKPRGAQQDAGRRTRRAMEDARQCDQEQEHAVLDHLEPAPDESDLSRCSVGGEIVLGSVEGLSHVRVRQSNMDTGSTAGPSEPGERPSSGPHMGDNTTGDGVGRGKSLDSRAKHTRGNGMLIPFANNHTGGVVVEEGIAMEEDGVER